MVEARGASKGQLSQLAVHGGMPAVTIPSPHFRWPLIGPEEEAAVLHQLRNGQLSVPSRSGIIEEFEVAFAASIGAQWAMSTNSGTAALHAAFFALDLEPGDEVLAPSYTHLGSVLPMLHANLVPVLCDVEAHTGNIDVLDAARRITPRTRAIVVTHQYGHICDMPAVLALAARHGLLVVEDCSHAHGATLDGQHAGTFGDVACFSLQAHKAVVAGEGGILVTRSARIFERAALLGHFRQRTSATSDEYAPFTDTGYGLKNRLHPLGAALALVQLRKLPSVISARKENLEYFTAVLEGMRAVTPLPTAPQVNRGGYFRYLLRYHAEQLNALPLERYIEALRAEGVAEIMPGSLAKPLHLTAFFQSTKDGMYKTGWPRRGPHASVARCYRRGDFPQAENFSARTIQFPAFTEPSRHIIDGYKAAMQKVEMHSAELVSM